MDDRRAMAVGGHRFRPCELHPEIGHLLAMLAANQLGQISLRRWLNAHHCPHDTPKIDGVYGVRLPPKLADPFRRGRKSRISFCQTRQEDRRVYVEADLHMRSDRHALVS